MLGSFALATFIVRLAMPQLSRRFTEWQVLTYTLFCATLAFGLFPFFTSLVPLIIVAFLLGLGLGAAQPNVMSLVHSRSPHGRVGEALGLALYHHSQQPGGAATRLRRLRVRGRRRGDVLDDGDVGVFRWRGGGAVGKA